MNARERVLRTINHELPDRPPVFVTLTPQVAERLSEHLGIPFEEPLDSLLSTRISHTGLLTRLGNDCVGIAACAPDNHPTITDAQGITTNEWGMRFQSTDLYNEFHEYPLAHAEGVDDIEQYPFPDPYATGRYTAAADTINRYKAEYAIVADLETSFFETAWYLVGMEKFLLDLLSGSRYVEALLDRIAAVNTAIGKELVSMGADILWAGDDFGTQHGMIMDPELWRMHFKPRIKSMFDAFRSVNPGIRIAWHSCGSIREIIPDLIEIGLDILNPIQPKARGMDPSYLKKEYGKDLVFFGGIDVQDLLPNASPGQIRSEVKRISDILGEQGGYIVGPAHNIQPDTPVENVLALFDAVLN